MIRSCPHHGFTELDQIDTFYNGLNDNDQDSLNAAAGGNLLSTTTREALQIMENKSKVRYLRNKLNVSRMNTKSRENANKTDDRIDKLADQISTFVDIFAKKVIAPTPVKAVEECCVTYGRPHAHYNCDATNRNQLSVCVATGTYNQVAPQNRASNYMAPPGFAPVQNSQNSGFFQNQASTLGTIPSNTNPNSKGEMKAITTRCGVAYEGSSIPTNPSPKKVVEQETEETTDKVQTNFQGSITHIQPLVTPILEPDVPKTLPKPNIPYPSRINDQKLHEKATNEMEKFFQIFIFADALLLMLKFASTIKTMLLKKLPEKIGDPGKFLIPCDFPRMDVCHALADLDARINLMHVSIWKKLSLPKLTPTQMTLELANRSITQPKGVTEDVFVKVRKFHFPTNFVVVDSEVDPRVPLILGRSFLRTGYPLIDVYGEEITLRVNDEAVTFNINQTTRYSSTHDDLSVNQIDMIDVAKEEDAQEVLGFSKYSLGGNPTSNSEPIISDSSPSLTLFEGNLTQGEVFKAKSSIEEPPKLELRDLPSHLAYAYLEGTDKLPVIIAKDLKDNEKEVLLKVLKSHKRAIAWKITDIKDYLTALGVAISCAIDKGMQSAQRTSGSVPTAAVTTTALSITFAYASSVPPISTDNYEIVGVYGQEVLKVGMPISTGITASVPYVSENGVSSLLDLIIVRCAHKTCEISSSKFLLLLSNRALIPSLKLLFALSTKTLACGCLMEAKHWRDSICHGISSSLAAYDSCLPFFLEEFLPR
nr:reverse transcriptase domain-containing protein [Tanacetum cinerariifolium]